MKKNRYLLCILLAALMLYFAVPRLSVTAGGTQGIFSIAWLGFALMVIAGNLTALLYTPKRQILKQQLGQLKKKSRSFH
ncbi:MULTISPECIES: hypothetical protein [Neobacillus]|uniref:Uncharacterized protein n=1 Tax=Neobacillus rhizophilus TaxID=2833579 RepID=A0A942UBY0_9BACI|nr:MULTISPECIES: hypothetical protein [Neobacillus]MBS4215374.1 hypothetical protein [Neobacillus rhizophilus]MBU8916730.1 YtxH domain-containing protein [Bacillus sp. FJAT-29953]